MLVARIQIFLTTCSRRTRFHFARVPTFYTPVRGTMSTALSGKRPDSPGHDPDTEIHDQDASIHNIKTPELPGVQHDNSFKDTSDNSVPRHKSVGIDDSKGSSITQDLSPTPRETENPATGIQELEHDRSIGSDNTENSSLEQPLQDSDKSKHSSNTSSKDEDKASVDLGLSQPPTEEQIISTPNALFPTTTNLVNDPSDQANRQDLQQQQQSSQITESLKTTDSHMDSDNPPTYDSQTHKEISPNVERSNVINDHIVKDLESEELLESNTKEIDESLKSLTQHFDAANSAHLEDGDVPEPEAVVSKLSDALPTNTDLSAPLPMASDDSKASVSEAFKALSTDNKVDNEIDILKSIQQEHDNPDKVQDINDADITTFSDGPDDSKDFKQDSKDPNSSSDLPVSEELKVYKDIMSVTLPDVNKEDLDRTFIESLALTTSTSIDKLEPAKPKQKEKELLDSIPFDIILPESLQTHLSKINVSGLFTVDTTTNSNGHDTLPTNTNFDNAQFLNHKSPLSSMDNLDGNDNDGNNVHSSIKTNKPLSEQLQDSQTFSTHHSQLTELSNSEILAEQPSKEFLETLASLNLKDFKDIDKFDTDMKEFERFDGLNLKDFKDLEKLDPSLLSAKLPESLDALDDLSLDHTDNPNIIRDIDPTTNHSLSATSQHNDTSLSGLPTELPMSITNLSDLSNTDLTSTDDLPIISRTHKNLPSRAQSEALVDSHISKPEIQSHAASVPHSPNITLNTKILDNLPLPSHLSNLAASLGLSSGDDSFNHETDLNVSFKDDESGPLKNTISDIDRSLVESVSLENERSKSSGDANLPSGQAPAADFVGSAQQIYDETSDRPTYQLSNSVAPMVAPGNTGTMTPGVFDQSPSLLPLDSISETQFNNARTSDKGLNVPFKHTSSFNKIPTSSHFSRSKSDKSSTLQAITALNSVTEDADGDSNMTGPDSFSGLNGLHGILPGSEINEGDDHLPRVSAYARLDFPTFIFYVQTLQVLLGRSGNNSTRSIVDVDLGPVKAISRKHAKLFYNFGTQRFELSVLGRNGAFVDDEFIETGSTVPLRDG